VALGKDPVKEKSKEDTNALQEGKSK